MKARLPQTKSLSYDFDQNITLSIGMIVKNEEKMLETCLARIKPLLDAVPSELVIIDTGSTDKTVEIAKRYTSKVYHFDWINDFGAARNFSLQKCKGQWFMFLDADDHFTDVSEMIKFFNTQDIHKNYNTAYYITRNFFDITYTDYSVFYVQRIARRTNDLHFEGAIHEAFTPIYTPSYYFNSYAYHYGYAFETEEIKETKRERNLSLLWKEYEQTPDDLRTLHHLVSCMKDADPQKPAIAERAMSLADAADNSTTPILYTAYFNAFDMYKNQGEPDKALAALTRAEKKATPDNAARIELHAARAVLLLELKKYAEAEQSLREYFALFERQDSLDKSVLAFLVSRYIAPEKYIELKNRHALCIALQGRPEAAFTAYDGLNFNTLDSALYKAVINAAAVIAKEYPPSQGGLAKLYETVATTCDSDKTSYFERKAEELYLTDKTLAENFKGTGKFAELMKICLDCNTADLAKFIGSQKLSAGYSEAAYLALKNNIDLSPALSRMNFEDILVHLSMIARYKADEVAALALNYRPASDDFYFTSIKHLLFATLLFETAIGGADKLEKADKSQVYNNYAKYSALFVANAYNPALLNESDIAALPETHRFGYYLGTAQKLLDTGDKLGYIKELKKALTACNSMQTVVQFLLEELTATL
ncbi:MAG: glycosyltransferase [Oscillospiraceae bacterium]|nr:glycosyltransferase [Oscillospiraceae bacterium]